MKLYVAPARERGLKSNNRLLSLHHLRRSREGAWIEMAIVTRAFPGDTCRSREGAWIEMLCRG